MRDVAGGRVTLILSRLAGLDCRLMYDLGELPGRLQRGKDIDLLVRPQGVDAVVFALRDQGLKETVHPTAMDVHIYGAPRRRMFARDGLYVDLHPKMVVRSIDAGQWLPLDQRVQDAAWAGNSQAGPGGVRVLPLAVELTYLFARCIFDKSAFPEANTARIAKLLPDADRALLSTVFFGFTDTLLGLADAGEWGDILPSFNTFAEY